MAVNEAGINCPGDISIIGFDDLLMSKVDPAETLDHFSADGRNVKEGC